MLYYDNFMDISLMFGHRVEDFNTSFGIVWANCFGRPTFLSKPCVTVMWEETWLICISLWLYKVTRKKQVLFNWPSLLS